MSDEMPEIPGTNMPPERPRRVIATPQPTRGRPADQAAAAVEAVDPETGKPFTRRGRALGGGNQFDVPIDLQDPNWSYEWKTTAVANQPVEASYSMAAYEGGWRPVRATGRWMKMCPPGYPDGKAIERDGQMLYMRPKSLNTEAQQEDLDVANKQLSDRIHAALATPDGQPKSMPRRIEQVDVQIDSGTYRSPQGAR